MLNGIDSSKSNLGAMETCLREQLPRTLLEAFPEEVSIPLSISGGQPKESSKGDPFSALQSCLAQHCPEQERNAGAFFGKQKAIESLKGDISW